MASNMYYSTQYNTRANVSGLPIRIQNVACLCFFLCRVFPYIVVLSPGGQKKAARILNVPQRVGHSKWAIISAACSVHRDTVYTKLLPHHLDGHLESP